MKPPAIPNASPALHLAGRLAALAALLYFGWLMLGITLQYVPARPDVAFLRIKQHVIDVWPWRLAFFVHVYTSLFALAAGFTQFSPGILARWRGVHRAMGRLYVLVILGVTGPASLLMAVYANGGPISQIAFGLLALGWMLTTALAWRRALQRRFPEHRAWMYRSYALTLSAITLRSWKMVLAMTLAPPPQDLYRFVAWLGWVPNLLVAELLIRAASRERPAARGSLREERLVL